MLDDNTSAARPGGAVVQGAEIYRGPLLSTVV